MASKAYDSAIDFVIKLSLMALCDIIITVEIVEIVEIVENLLIILFTISWNFCSILSYSENYKSSPKKIKNYLVFLWVSESLEGCQWNSLFSRICAVCVRISIFNWKSYISCARLFCAEKSPIRFSTFMEDGTKIITHKASNCQENEIAGQGFRWRLLSVGWQKYIIRKNGRFLLKCEVSH